MASLIDEQGRWVGPGPDPRAPGATTTNPVTVPQGPIAGLPAPQPGEIDWRSLIEADPGYMSSQLSFGERKDIAGSNRRAALRALAIRYGGIPASMKDVYGDLDQGTLDTAAANPMSDRARLARSGAETTEQYKRQLAARGALQSGDLGYGLDQINYNQATQEYDLAEQYGNSAQSAINDYASILSGLSSEQIQAIRDAADRVISMNPNGIPTTQSSSTLNEPTVTDTTTSTSTDAAADWIARLQTPDTAPDTRRFSELMKTQF